MIYVIIFPAVAFLLALIIGVIIVLLKWGPIICGVRHHALPDEREWDDKVYDHGISYAWFFMLMEIRHVTYRTIHRTAPHLSHIPFNIYSLNEKPLILFCILDHWTLSVN